MTPLSPPLIHTPRGDLPVLLSVPHSGRDYPDWLVALAAGGKPALASLEDPLVDRLAWRAIASGVGAVVARAPRAAVDCNRGEDEVDPAVVEGWRRERLTARARGGLGIVPARTPQHGFLWRRAIGPAELEQRLEQAHRPYHQAIAHELAGLTERFGCAVLIDCHSMPPPPDGIPEIVFGDCRGRSADAAVSLEALQITRQAGFETGLNDPFAGGHIVARHSDPERNIHALQLEIDRRCYLADGAPGARFDEVAALIAALAAGLGELLLRPRFATAAE